MEETEREGEGRTEREGQGGRTGKDEKGEQLNAHDGLCVEIGQFFLEI